ncbi:hypothetical protein AGMMS49940_09660 [Spirochaetia bacterium]|nr:hypothetical protein AGMMS49940_09660 [Spirochaetia bacterium]
MEKIVFFNITWMDHYQGPEDIVPEFGGQFPKDHGYGHEMRNFQEYDGKMYGYFRLGKQDDANPKRLGIDRLGAKRSDSKISGVDVIWVAHDPRRGGTYIVG